MEKSDVTTKYIKQSEDQILIVTERPGQGEVRTVAKVVPPIRVSTNGNSNGRRKMEE